MPALFPVSPRCSDLAARVLGLFVLTLAACAHQPATQAPSAATASSVEVATSDTQTPEAEESGVTMSEILNAFQVQDMPRTVALLERRVREVPEDARAWAFLGQARSILAVQGDVADAELLKAAERAYEQALELDPSLSGAAFGLAGLMARGGDTEGALTRLEELAARGDVDLSQVALNPQFAALQDHPRFQALPPNAEDFERPPFVEPTRVLHEWRAEAAGDAFGWIARRLGDGPDGDVDGDGIADLTTSAPNHQVGELVRAGRVYVYSGKSGELLWTRDGDVAGGQLGQGIETAGDVNGDGRPDVLAAAPGADVAYVFDGRTGETLLAISGSEGSGSKGEQFGRHVHGVGDVDGDGHGDLLIGAPRFDPTEELQDAGRAALYSGKDGGLLHQWIGEQAGDRLGEAVAGGVEGKGDRARPILILGAPDAGEGDRGRVYVYSELTGSTAGDGAQFVIDSDEQGAELGGMFLSVVGDVDGDGRQDVYASDWAHAGLGPQSGRIVVHSGATGEQLIELKGEASGDGFGIGSADAGDANDDGHADLIVGAWQHDGGAPAGGKVYLYSGKDSSLLRTWTCQVMGDTFGFDATRLDDVDGDGKMDYLLTSAWSAVEGPRSGRVFVVAGGV